MDLVDAFDANRPLLVAIAHSMLGSAIDAEDVVQEAYLRAQRAAPQELHRPRAYFSKIVTRLCLDTLNSARVTHGQSLEQLCGAPSLVASGDLPLDVAVRHEAVSSAWQILLERLTPQERRVFVLREVFEYPYEEIARQMGRSTASCRQLFHRAQYHLAAGQTRFTPSPETHQHLVSRFIATVT
jgi:RNA polymerase sigma-70 factor (ECF subfamily)